jgi:alkylated DNA repair dioxygenase AlkB
MNASSPRGVRPSSTFAQADLFAAPALLPEGFTYRPDVVSPDEEEALARELGALPFKPFDFHGYLANRQVVSFGYRYDYGIRSVVEATPFPEFLESLRRKVAALFDRPPETFRQVLINQYQPGAGIGWHRDKAQFDEVVGVSLLAPCSLRFRRKSGATWKRVARGRAALGLSALGAGPHGVGAQHSGSRPPSLLDHFADARRDRRGAPPQRENSHTASDKTTLTRIPVVIGA